MFFIIYSISEWWWGEGQRIANIYDRKYRIIKNIRGAEFLITAQMPFYEDQFFIVRFNEAFQISYRYWRMHSLLNEHRLLHRRSKCQADGGRFVFGISKIAITRMK